ncbi:MULTISPECIES: MIP/aquaporin family protein [unclassified Cupriavidus]|uniref:aquaporin n=1 Tax=unclassified Cupriavidus TaxID=2640874 RepID=UPI001AE96EA0|nr:MULTISPECIES: MIP/aquaporin family protein [unclassified Cupriavidus]MBP0629851.1 aquaporin family protein [Cupriavidus sp. AcVe19-1a]MBP0635249.1 aquaporin family protein [Cupriavidus sp. AcVe19-6a]
MSTHARRRMVAEGLGTALLVAIVIGSGIRAERLAGGDTALALLANSLATGAGLVALLVSLGPVSGGHFNPVVSLSALVQGTLSPRDALRYVAVQLAGAVCGVLAAHAMFGEPALAWSGQARTGASMWWSECVATFGLVGVGIGTLRSRPQLVPFVVAGYITAGYWFTSSTSFANPALTIACALTDSFTGIRPVDVPGFVLAQLGGGLAATLVFHWLCRKPAGEDSAAHASNPAKADSATTAASSRRSWQAGATSAD